MALVNFHIAVLIELLGEVTGEVALAPFVLFELQTYLQFSSTLAVPF